MKRLSIVAACLASALALGGCGEKATVTVYKQGKYQGKPDKQPWDNDQFKGDRTTWEQSVKKRNDGQNEYARLTPSAN